MEEIRINEETNKIYERKKMKQYVFMFGKTEGSKALLGGKGYGLSEMTKLGMPIPPGFTITAEAGNEFFKRGEEFVNELWSEVNKKLAELEIKTNKKFGDRHNPLLVSVRSGAAISMPGMMDTILNLGLNEDTIKGLSENTDDERFAFDSYRRFVQMFGNVVLGMENSKFEDIINNIKGEKGVKQDVELKADDLKEIVGRFKELIKREKKTDFPEEPKNQLRIAIKAVFNSWNNERARIYRKLNSIPDDIGTAVNVQSMVFGNVGVDSGTGVCFTRNPSTGEKKVYGEYLLNAQGEDVVAGIRTPKQIDNLKENIQEAYEELINACQKLEEHFKNVQDIEFTIEHKKLFLLQTRTAKRTAQANVKIAVDMVNERLINEEEAIIRVTPEQIEKLLHKRIDTNAKLNIITKGLPASPGAATGRVVFTADKADELAKKGEKVILVRKETSPEDIHGMTISMGVLTARGGMTSHAAVVARGMGKCCITGCEDIKINEKEGYFEVKGVKINEGNIISLNGNNGEVILGEAPLLEPEIGDSFKTILKWADKIRRLGVRTNADTPHDAEIARRFGAEGIGLCRTEHMFFGEKRIPVMQSMILAETKEERENYLNQLLPLQKNDFIGIFKEMSGFPVIIRLLDPPLHEFLPKREELMVKTAVMKAKGEDEKEIKKEEGVLKRIEELYEFNPMLGHRGCRLGITFPEITRMQVRAIFEAACEVKKQGINVLPEIMIPLIGSTNELKDQKKVIKEVADQTLKEYNLSIDYKIGTMIELPRAALLADKIAEEADFFSFGTNDLTQTTLGFSRDDSGKFIKIYLEKGILKDNPFKTIDVKGVGKLVETGTSLGKKTKPNLEVGICGEHGGDPKSIEFFNKAGLDYVSCSPYRVPIARLAAAQATIKIKYKKRQ